MFAYIIAYLTCTIFSYLGWIIGQHYEKGDLRLPPLSYTNAYHLPKQPKEAKTKTKTKKQKGNSAKTNLYLRLCGGKAFIS